MRQLCRLRIQDPQLKKSLCIPEPSADASSIEKYYTDNHPFLKLATQYPPTLDENGIPAIPPVNVLPSSGYVLHTLVAALYAFFVTDSFHTGALLAVNMGSDADTVGAVYGGLAGAWYVWDFVCAGFEFVLILFVVLRYASLEDGGFGSKVTRDWVDDLRGKDILEKVITKFIEYEEKVRSKQMSATDV
jgi:hypothetical protein